MKQYATNYQRRKVRNRAKIKQVSDRPRLSVTRSNQHIYATLVDPENGNVLATASDLLLEGKVKQTKIEKAFEVGKQLATLALKKNCTQAVFDRGGYRYHGRVKAICEGARTGNLVI